MATIFLNAGIAATERPWSAKNGATRRELVLVNKTGREVAAGEALNASLGFLDKGNHSFIFLNPQRGEDSRVLGIFLCDSYGYRVVGREVPDGYWSYQEPFVSGYDPDPEAVKARDEWRARRDEYLSRLRETELYTASSVGGYGNSESRFGVYRPGTVIAVASYKGRQGETFSRLDPEKGWVSLGVDVPLWEGEVTEI